MAMVTSVQSGETLPPIRIVGHSLSRVNAQLGKTSELPLTQFGPPERGT